MGFRHRCPKCGDTIWSEEQNIVYCELCDKWWLVEEFKDFKELKKHLDKLKHH